jgi:hypothetical protein
MSTELGIKFHKTAQFRNVVSNVRKAAQFKGIDDKGNVITDPLAVMPTIEYTGTVKLHGTNGSIIHHEDQTTTFHSKERTLALLTADGEFIHYGDNAEFAQSMERRVVGVLYTIKEAARACKMLHGEVIYPLKISGEWAGKGVQKNVGISNMDGKAFFIFGVKAGETNTPCDVGWIPQILIKNVESVDSHIYNIMSFPTRTIDIDFNFPERTQNYLVEATNEVEEECPVAKQLGLEGDLLGEGLVWVPSGSRCVDTGFWFKTKGQKHSTSNVKTMAAICPEKLKSIQEFVDYAATKNRLEQGIQEIGLDQKTIGQYIGWVNRDINTEEGDVLESSNLSMKDVGKNISTVARTFYLTRLAQV